MAQSRKHHVDVPFAYTENPGEFIGVEPLAQVKIEECELLWCKSGCGIPDQLRQLAVAEYRLGVRCTVRIDDGIRFKLVTFVFAFDREGDDAARAAALVNRSITSDREEPGTESGTLAERWQRFPRLDKCRLHDLFGRIGVTDRADDEVIQRGTVTTVKLRECRFFARSGLSGELVIR